MAARAKVLIVVAATISGASPAVFAQAPGLVSASADEPTSIPGFATLDRGDDTTRVGIESSYLFTGNTPDERVTALRFDAHLQYVSAGGWGAYLLFPITRMGINYADNSLDTSATGIGDIELGGLHIRSLGHGVTLVGRFGATVPTGSINGSLLWESPTTGGDANLYASLARLTDVVDALPTGISFRFAGSALWRRGAMFARADAGFDGCLVTSTDNGPTNPADLRFNLGVGVVLGPAALTAEWVNLYSPGLTQLFGAHAYMTGALSARARLGPADVYVAAVAPLAHATQVLDRGTATFDAAVTMGLEGRFARRASTGR